MGGTFASFAEDERPHAALVWLHHVIAASGEADGLVVHVEPSASLAPLRGQPGSGVPFVVFDPHPPCVVSESERMIQVASHVLNVEHGDGGPGPFGKRHCGAGRSLARCVGNTAHPPCCPATVWQNKSLWSQLSVHSHSENRPLRGAVKSWILNS